MAGEIRNRNTTASDIIPIFNISFPNFFASFPKLENKNLIANSNNNIDNNIINVSSILL